MKSSYRRVLGIVKPILLTITGAFLFPSIADAQSKNTPPPNIIFIMCDQMRGDAFGAAGNKNARTPNIDKLAAYNQEAGEPLIKARAPWYGDHPQNCGHPD